MANDQSLNDIGPGVSIISRDARWSVRFRLPARIADQYDLPGMPRLVTDRLRGDLSDPQRRREAFRREANRIGAKLDLLLAGHEAPAPGETLAHWLGLVETTRVRRNSSRRVPKDKTWSYLVQRYIDTFENESIAREGNLADAVRRLEAIRDLGFCKGRFPPDISPDEWDEFFDSLMAERPDASRGQTTRLVLDAARELLQRQPTVTVPALTDAVRPSVKRQSIEAHVRVLVREGWLAQIMAAPRKGLKRQARTLGPGPRFDQPFVVAKQRHSARTVNKMRALVRRIYDFGIRHRMFGRENPVLLTARRTAGRRLSARPCYRTKSMILEELDRKRYTPAQVRQLHRYRVLDEADQIELMTIAKDRADLQMLEPLICGLHGVSGVDVREMLKGAYNAKTGILSGQRHKTGQAKFSVPIAPALRQYLDRHIVRLTHGSWMFPQFRTGQGGEPCDPKGRMDRLFQRLVSGTEFEGLTFYCLRHSFISLMLAKSIPAGQVALWAGHLDTKLTTTPYSHFLPDESVQQMEAIRLFEAVS